MSSAVQTAPNPRYPIMGEINYVKRVSHSNRQRAFLDLAVRLAESSELEFKHGAVVVRGGSVLAVGVNKWKNRNLPPTPVTEYNPNLTVHAEMDALSRIANPKGVTIYVARVNKHGEERLSHPCENCEQKLMEAGVKKVIFTFG